MGLPEQRFKPKISQQGSSSRRRAREKGISGYRNCLRERTNSLCPQLDSRSSHTYGKDIAIEEGQTLRSDIRLEWPLNLGTVGDDTILIIRNRYAGLTGSTPR